MNQTKFQRLLHCLMTKQERVLLSNSVCCNNPRQSQQESDHLMTSTASATASHCLCTRSRPSVNLSKELTNNSEQKYYLCEYQYEGEKWSFEIPAESWKDAQSRLARMAYGNVVGEIKAVLPVQLGILARLWIWITN